MATRDVVRVIWALGAIACSETQSAPPRTAVSQTSLTSAEATQVQMRLPPGYGDTAPRTVNTPLQRQMEEDQRYPVPSMETANEWSERYPFAANTLRDWTATYPQAAEKLLRWEDEQPDHVRSLVRWAVANRYDGMGSFLLARRGWDDLRAIRDENPEAVDAFLAWCRAAPKAADELVMHSEGLGRVVMKTAPKERALK